jgi:uncharacterized membrane protein
MASITDRARNTGTATQTLTIGDRPPVARYQPDAAIRLLNGAWVGGGTYEASQQRVTKRLRGLTRSATFQVRVTNRGNSAERMKLRGSPRNGNFTVTYRAGVKDVTAAVTAGTYLTTTLAPGGSAQLVMKVTKTKAASPGDSRTFKVRAGSSHSSTALDTVAAIVQVA